MFEIFKFISPMSLTGPCNKCEVGPQNFVESTDKQTDEMGKTMKGNALYP